MFDRFAGFLLRHRLLFISGALALTFVMAIPLVPPDQIRFDFSFKRLFRFEGEEASRLTHFKNLFGDDAGATGVLFLLPRGSDGERPAVLAPEPARAMARLQDWLLTREELDREYTISPLSATDFFAEPVLSGALRQALDALPAQLDREVFARWQAAGPLPPELREYGEVARRIWQHDMYRGMLLSDDGSAGAVAFRFALSHNHPTARQTFLEEFEARVQAEREALGEGVQLATFGIPVVTREYTRLSVQDIVRTAPLSLLIMTLFLFLLFRNAMATIIPQVVVLLAVICAIGFMQWTDEPLNIISHIVPVIVLVVGVADGVHILSRYAEERHRGLASTPAVRQTVTMLSKACFLTSATTAIGFASLMTATIATISSFGLYTAIAVMFTYVVNMTLLPIGLSLTRSLPRQPAGDSRVTATLEWIADFAIRHARALFAGSLVAALVGVVVVVLGLEVDSHLLEEVPPENSVYQATKTMERRLSPIIPLDVLVEGRRYEDHPCGNDADCTSATDLPAPDNLVCVTTGQTRRALAPSRDAFGSLLAPEEMGLFDALEGAVNEHLPEGRGTCVESVKDPALLRALVALAADLRNDPRSSPHVGRVESLAQVVQQMHQALQLGPGGRGEIPATRAAVSQLLLPIESSSQGLLDRYATLDYDATRVTLLHRDHGSAAWQETATVVDESLARHMGGESGLDERFSTTVTGTMTFVDKALSYIVHDMLLSVSTAFLFIFLLMVALFRSLRIGLLSILPNIFPLLATLVLMVVAHVALRTSTIIIFSISLGIAVNDTIHFIARYNEEVARGLAKAAAIRSAMRSAGKAMVVTTLILAGGFLVDLISEFVALQQFGYLASFTLLMALLGDLLILPACLMLFDKSGGEAA